ncbi:MAG: hypothetical protein A4E66_00679 [Syntrophus sp. PtaB.Bin001]|nr:MAG: hypothetical protein A4E66_00679 [Syntrophus sp. PtaB.Bin001]
MGAQPRLKKKDELHYRKGSTIESNNCRYCTSFVREFCVYKKVGDSIKVDLECRCMIMGLDEGRRYNIREDYTCDAQKFDGTDFSKRRS